MGALYPRSQIHASALRATAEVSPTCTEAPSAAASAGLRGPDPVPARTAPRPEAPARLWWRSRQEAPRTFPPWRGKPCPSSVGRRPPGQRRPPQPAPQPLICTLSPYLQAAALPASSPPPSGCVKCLRPGTRMSPGPSREEARCETAGRAARPPLCPTGPQGRDAQPESVCRRRSPHGPRSPSRSAVASCRDVLIFCAF